MSVVTQSLSSSSLTPHLPLPADEQAGNVFGDIVIILRHSRLLGILIMSPLVSGGRFLLFGGVPPMFGGMFPILGGMFPDFGGVPPMFEGMFPTFGGLFFRGN